MKSVKNELLLW